MVSSKAQYLSRIKETREWFLERDKNMLSSKKFLQNTFLIYSKYYKDNNFGFVFEGAQAVGLDPNFGRRPDTTSTDTTVYGIMRGTKFPFWNSNNIKERIGVIKLTYMSSVGEVRMITDSGLERKSYSPSEINVLKDPNKKFAAWAREEAHEFGATTGRPRDICFLDLEILAYNSITGGINAIAGTHLDIAREDIKIPVCIGYKNQKGNFVPYQPGVHYQKNLTPEYIYLDGWNGKKTRKATSFNELPINAQRYLIFLERVLGIPIVYVTCGPERRHAIDFLS